MATEQWGFFNVPHLLWHGPTYHEWHSHLLPSVWQWSSHFLFYRLTGSSVPIAIPNPYLPTTPPRRLKNCADVFVFLLMYICIRYNVSFFLYTAYRLLLYHLSKQNIWSAHIWENTLYVEDAKKQCKYVSLVSSWSFLLFRFYGLNLILFFFISKIIIR